MMKRILESYQKDYASPEMEKKITTKTESII